MEKRSSDLGKVLFTQKMIDMQRTAIPIPSHLLDDDYALAMFLRQHAPNCKAYSLFIERQIQKHERSEKRIHDSAVHNLHAGGAWLRRIFTPDEPATTLLCLSRKCEGHKTCPACGWIFYKP